MQRFLSFRCYVSGIVVVDTRFRPAHSAQLLVCVQDSQNTSCVRGSLAVAALRLSPLYVPPRFTHLSALRSGCFTFLAGKFGWPRERFEDKFTTLRIAWAKLRHPKGYLNMVRRQIGLETESKSSCGRGRQLAIAEHDQKKKKSKTKRITRV